MDGLFKIVLHSADPDDLTLKQARLLGRADHIFHEVNMSDAILNRARADAVRHVGAPPAPPPPGLVLHLQLQGSEDGKKNSG
jgi:uroporphyrin-III C-methyltransferase / precorrin-2 dehydrogenase / sirohydrochlorin ferrochelatase